LKLGVVEMKKYEKKKHILQFEKKYFLGFAFQRLFVKLERCSYNILNHSKWRRIEKDLQSVQS
jgi:hypothetical protein